MHFWYILGSLSKVIDKEIWPALWPCFCSFEPHRTKSSKIFTCKQSVLFLYSKTESSYQLSESEVEQYDSWAMFFAIASRTGTIWRTPSHCVLKKAIPPLDIFSSACALHLYSFLPRLFFHPTKSIHLHNVKPSPCVG